METEQLFMRASEEFQETSYQRGLQIITRCIQKDPFNSLLYCNRGLFYAQLGENQAAAKDLERAIELNHLNYLAYFNLFSLQYREGDQEQAFDNLCCSLSCLYLLRAKKSRRELDVQRAISYADNNFQAYVLKSLMYLEDGRLVPALNYMEWACDLNPQSILCKKLKNIISKRIDPYAPEDYIEQGKDASKGMRLKSSYKPEQDFQYQVREKVIEFNDIYDDFLGQEGTVTQKVPRILTQNDKTQMKSRMLSEQSGIYQFKLKNHKVSSILGSGEEKASEAATKQGLPEEEGKQQPNAIVSKEQLESSVGNILHGQIQQAWESKQLESQQNLLDGSIEQKRQVLEQAVEIVKQKVLIEEPQQNLLEEEARAPEKVEAVTQIVSEPVIQMQQKREPEQEKIQVVFEQKIQLPPRPLESRQSQSKNKKEVRSASSSKKGTTSNSKVSEASSSNTQSINLYPIGSKKKIQFTIIGAEVKSPGKHKDFYLTGNYNSRKGQRIRTQIKKLQGNNCKWYCGNPPTGIAEVAKTLNVKLYSKQYFSVDDELIGEGEVQVLRSGQLKIPVYYKTKTTGLVSVRVDVM